MIIDENEWNHKLMILFVLLYRLLIKILLWIIINFFDLFFELDGDVSFIRPRLSDLVESKI